MPSNQSPFPRREFLKQAGFATFSAAALSSFSWKSSTAQAAEPAGPVLKKAVKIGMVQEGETLLDKFKLVKSLGYDGIELNAPNDISTEEVIAARDESGLPIHGVVNSTHWQKTLTHPDPAIRKEGTESVIQSVQDSKAYGGTSVLIVLGKVQKDVSYQEAYDRSQAAMKEILPHAEDAGIHVLVENVWNNFLLSPMEEARYIDELDSPMAGAYFDVGNVVRFGWPEHWIRTLNKRIIKLDIKEYSRKLQFEEGTGKGFGVELGDGDCDWPAVMQALRDIEYSGWATAEVRGGDAERLKDIEQRMEKCFAS
ncbi:sugar phosphate isomerase/epimerase family protein [Polystyrenella longa]|nr:sugar phosphate isomerase/epimerase family protein [Polystyrenella longa]